MTAINEQLNLLATMLETAEVYAHLERAPYNLPYRRFGHFDPGQGGHENGCRRFTLTVSESTPQLEGRASGLCFVHEATLRVAYPFAHQHGRAAEYFAAECELVRELVADPDQWLDARIRLIDYRDSAIELRDERWVDMVHRLRLIVDETN